MNALTAAGKGIKEVARIEFVKKMHLQSRDAPELAPAPAPAPVPRVPAPAPEPEPGVAGAGAKEGLGIVS